MAKSDGLVGAMAMTCKWLTVSRAHKGAIPSSSYTIRSRLHSINKVTTDWAGRELFLMTRLSPSAPKLLFTNQVQSPCRGNQSFPLENVRHWPVLIPDHFETSISWTVMRTGSLSWHPPIGTEFASCPFRCFVYRGTCGKNDNNWSKLVFLAAHLIKCQPQSNEKLK